MIKTIKSAAVSVLTPLSRYYFRSTPPHRFKIPYWERFFNPYLGWREMPAVVTSRTADGSRMELHPENDVEKFIYLYGCWEPGITELFRRALRPGDHVIDVGANVGYFSLLASRRVGPAGKVYAIEPTSLIRNRLEANLALNPNGNIQIVPYAAWDSAGSTEIYIHDSSALGGTSLKETENSRKETVELIRLETMIPQSDDRKIRLIKVDIEGAELHAFRGMERIFSAPNEDLIVISEMIPKYLQAFGDTAADFFAFFKRHGFRAFKLNFDYTGRAHLSAPPRPIRLEQPTDEDCDLVFVRREEEWL